MLRRYAVRLVLLLSLLLMGSGLTHATPNQAQELATTIYLPMVYSPLQPSPYGIQSYGMGIAPITVRAQELGSYWLRHDKISWKDIQPTPTRTYDWSQMADTEADILAANSIGMEAVLIVNDSPAWATINGTNCGAIRTEHFADFAAFMAALVTRYSQPPYNILHWELGNEVDVDPRLVPSDAMWGCWGNIDDPWYGGEHYGNMIKAVVPAMRAANPHVKIWMGGLLLGTYNTTDPGLGHPELFFEGVLRVGAAPYIDYVPYHGHSVYGGRYKDHSGAGGGWLPWGGPAYGKPAFLREVMSRYAVSLPLYFNEGSLGYTGTTPTNDFIQAQADHVSRAFVRTLAADVKGVMWYALENPGWRYCGLLDDMINPKPAFYAYQTLIELTKDARAAPTPVTYVSGIEAYRFNNGSSVTDVLWSTTTATQTISVPQASFIAAYDRDGAVIPPTIVGSSATFTVGWRTLYIVRTP